MLGFKKKYGTTLITLKSTKLMERITQTKNDQFYNYVMCELYLINPGLKKFGVEKFTVYLGWLGLA